MEKKNIPKEKLTIDSTQSFKSITDEDNNFYIEGYASVSVKDRDWDIIPVSSIDTQNFEKNPIILYQHNKSVPVGKAVEVEKRSDGLWMKVQISETAKDVRTLIEEDILKAFSVGFILKDYYYDDNKDAFIYKDMELTETSIVSVPANQDALFSMVKSYNENLTKPEQKPKTKDIKNPEPTNREKDMTDLEKLQKEMQELKAEKIRLEEEKALQVAREKEAKEKAEKEAITKSIEDIPTSIAAFNDKVKEMEEAIETAKKELQDKIEEIEKQAPRVQGIAPEEKTIDKFMESFKDIYLASHLYKKEATDTILFSKLPERVKSVTWDAQFLDIVRDNLLEDIWNNADLFNMFQRIPSEILNDTLPFMPGLTAQWESSATDQGFQPGKVTVEYHSVMSRMNYNYITDEESVVTWMPFIRRDMTRAITQEITKQILNPSGTVPAGTYKGATAYAIGGGFTAPIASADSFLVGDVDAIRAKMLKYGVRPQDLVLVLDSQQFLSLVTADEVTTVDKFGPTATIHTGVVGSVRGIQIVQNDDAPSGGDGSADIANGIILNTNHWLVKLKDFIMEWDKNVVTQRADLVGSARVGFAPAFPLVADEIDRPIAAVGVNPTP